MVTSVLMLLLDTNTSSCPCLGVMIVEPSGEKFELEVGDGLRLRCTAGESCVQFHYIL